VSLLRRVLSVCLLCGAVAAGAAEPCPQADPEALELLARVANEAGAVNFEGVVTLQRGGSTRRMTLRHRSADGSESEALTLLDGQEARVVRGDHPLNCEHPGHRLLRAAAVAGDCGIAAHYRLGTGPGERVAGRRAQRLVLEPRDIYRHGYVFEVDRETALILKVTILAAGGRPLEQFQFASLHLEAGASAVEAVPPVHRAQHPHPEHSQEETAAKLAWAPGWMPAGFVSTDAVPATSARRTYTDGMAVFSVFIETLSPALQPGEGVVREGSTVSYTRGRRVGGKAVLVTVLGEIPVNTARMVADAVQPAS
jgi:sigma-E factor negative regulatory protein RseB